MNLKFEIISDSKHTSNQYKSHESFRDRTQILLVILSEFKQIS